MKKSIGEILEMMNDDEMLIQSADVKQLDHENLYQFHFDSKAKDFLFVEYDVDHTWPK